jgi:glycolate oxidase iron-sulfur subunit
MRITDLRELTSRCIHCGLCLESCPTFVISVDEVHSPRGRIHLIRSVLEGKLDWGREIEEPLSTCLGCLACESACPSGVEYGTILQLARQKQNGLVGSGLKKRLADSITEPRTLRAQLAIGRLWPGKRIPFFVANFRAPCRGRDASA